MAEHNIADNILGTALGTALFILPLAGSIHAILKSCFQQVSVLKLTPNTSEKFSLKAKLVFTILLMFYGLFLLIFFGIKMINLWMPLVKIPSWLYGVFIILVAPYLGCVLGLQYGLGASVTASGIPAGRILKDALSENSKKVIKTD